MQPGSHAVAARIAYGCRYIYIRLQVYIYGCRCDSLNRRKDANTLRILERSYSDINLLFVQVRVRVVCTVRVRVIG